MSAPVVRCPACHGDRLAVMPEVSIEMYWSRKPNESSYNGSITAEVHVCMHCGHLSLFAKNPGAVAASFGSLVSEQKAT